MRTVTAAAGPALVYLIVLGQAQPLDVLFAVVVGAALALGLRRYGEITERPVPLLLRPAALWRLALRVAGRALGGAWTVLRSLGGLRPAPRSGVVAVPLGGRTPSEAVFTALTQTLSPGSILLEVDWDRGVMLFHVMGARPDRFRADAEACTR